ncbi:MAG: helix-turn-helix transcriptional regulator [Flavobacteriales bacterium]|jgi:AraC-like DNA-binding protein|nr:helix-turn-helix transcriptional regulator [Flavobacteriales bacterium]
MLSKKIYIRNMVCDRCTTAVSNLLIGSGLQYVSIMLGQVILDRPLKTRERAELEKGLKRLGFELIESKQARTVEQIKGVLREHVRSSALTRANVKLSEWLASAMNAEYSGLSKLFSEVEGTTLERYHNLLRIERAKELLVYDELSVAQIADELGYSSVQHLSNQFAQFVGHSPTHFKRIGAERRNALDKVR